MAVYWLDANIFIEPGKVWYSLDIVPAYWDWLDRGIADGSFRSPLLVYDEVVNDAPDDPIVAWVRERKDSGLFVEPDDRVQAVLKQIADYVALTYPAPEKEKCLDGADPWLVAYAKARGGTVVTLETPDRGTFQKAKIPNLCAVYGVPCMDLRTLLRTLGVTFGTGK